MEFNKNNIHFHYKVLSGENGKKYYVLTKQFWDFIKSERNNPKFKTKRGIATYFSKLSNGKITQRALENWLYTDKKPATVDSFETPHNNTGCPHNSNFFCPICKINKTNQPSCPTPLFWPTSPGGKTYIYEPYWNELKHFIDNHLKYGLILSNLYPKIGIDQRTVRHWKVNKGLPRIFTKDEFSFNRHNLYFLGLYLSDGHLRNNGSTHSYSYQVGSSDIFQGYWYHQLIQRFLPIFKHKNKFSNTYIVKDLTHNKTYFKTNLSSLSPIFATKLLVSKLIERRKNTTTTGFKKIIPKRFLQEINSHKEYFQGVFDGDGSYSLRTSPQISLATSPETNYKHFIDCLGLVPTLTSEDHKTSLPYCKRGSDNLYVITFAPGSLKHLHKNYNAQHVVDQLDFIIDSATNSIRPDKVHKLIKIVERVTSKAYGECTNSLPIQKEIRDLSLKRNLNNKAEVLKLQYPIKNNKYQPFMPKWAEGLCSKEEAWEFFFDKENLVFRTENKYLKNLDFSEGIPTNQKL